MKRFIQLVVQSKSSDDYRAFVYCDDSTGARWEIRGYGTTALAAAEDGMARFDTDELDWYMFGANQFVE